MSECEYCIEDLCAVTFEGSEFQCPHAVKLDDGSEVVRGCSATDDDLMTEEEYDAFIAGLEHDLELERRHPICFKIGYYFGRFAAWLHHDLGGDSS